MAASAGAAVDVDERFVSPIDNSRVDMTLWSTALSPLGVGVDTTIVNGLALSRLTRSSRKYGAALHAAENTKHAHYDDLCQDCNLSFRTAVLGVDGGLGPELAEMLNLLWAEKRAAALARGASVREVNGQERRGLEELATFMAKCRHRALYQNLTDRTAGEFTIPQHEDPIEEGDDPEEG